LDVIERRGYGQYRADRLWRWTSHRRAKRPLRVADSLRILEAIRLL